MVPGLARKYNTENYKDEQHQTVAVSNLHQLFERFYDILDEEQTLIYSLYLLIYACLIHFVHVK
jgi:hypothetical protein